MRLTMSPNATLSSLSLCAALVLLGACEPPAESSDELAVDETAGAIVTSVDQTALLENFLGDGSLRRLPLSLARPLVIDGARRGLESLVEPRHPDCAVETTLDQSPDDPELQILRVSYDHCPAGFLRLIELDGSLSVSFGFESEPCDQDALLQCPSALRFTLQTDYLRIGARYGDRFTELSDAAWELYDPLDDSAEAITEWASEYTVRNHRGNQLSVDTRARWSVARDDIERCVTLHQFDTELSIAGRDELRTIAATGSDLVRCNNRCPARGSVRMSYGTGRILRWTYLGDDTARVTGPEGAEFDILLPCADEATAEPDAL